MPPKFSLQTVLDVRHSKVESIEIDMGRLQQEKQQRENHLEELYKTQDILYLSLQASMQGVLDLVQVNLLRTDINRISQEQENTVLNIQELEQAVEAKRLELIEAKKEEEALKVLKNKEHERFLEEEKEKEKRFMDDVYISQGFRQRRNEMWL